jgi:hypothetical protein
VVLSAAAPGAANNAPATKAAEAAATEPTRVISTMHVLPHSSYPVGSYLSKKTNRSSIQSRRAGLLRTVNLMLDAKSRAGQTHPV